MTTCSLKIIPSNGHWCSNREQKAGKRGQQQSAAEIQELMQPTAGLISAQPSVPTTLSSKDRGAAAPPQDVPRPSPAGVKLWLLPSAWTRGSLSPWSRTPRGSRVPDSSEPPSLWEAQTGKSPLTIPGGVGRQGALLQSRAAEGWQQGSQEEGAELGPHLARQTHLDFPLWERFPHPRQRPTSWPLAEKRTVRFQSAQCGHGAHRAQAPRSAWLCPEGRWRTPTMGRAPLLPAH